MAMSEGSGLIRGLEGVVAAETQLCDLDGLNGRLAYRGYDIADLARKATFEEVTYLLLNGELPKAAQLDTLVVGLTAAREIPREMLQVFRLAPRGTDPMRVLQATVAMLGMSDPEATDNSHAANVRKSVRLTSQFAVAICAHHRVRQGLEPVPSPAGLSHAPNFLCMLIGDPARHGRGGVQAVGPVQVVRDARQAPRAHRQGEGIDPQRGLLLGAALLLARHPGRSVHARDRGRADRRLVRQYHRAARRQPADPPARGLRGPQAPRVRAARQ